MRIGIVGSEAAKFTSVTEAKARELIRSLISLGDVIISGKCHLGGIDLWAVEEAQKLGITYKEYPPRYKSWENGYKERNLQIAEDSQKVICITVKKLPDSYNGMKFPYCYHCKTYGHIKSGGCWTVKQAIRMGRIGLVLVVEE